MNSGSVILVFLFFYFSAVNAGGDIYNSYFLMPRRFDENDSSPSFLHHKKTKEVAEKRNDVPERLIYLPRCLLDSDNKPTSFITGPCSGRCRRTKIVFRANFFDVKEDSCCCVNWDVIANQ